MRSVGNGHGAQGDTGVVLRLELLVAHGHLHVCAISRRTQGDAVKRVGDQPLQHLSPRLFHIHAVFRGAHAPAPEVTNHQRGDAPLAKFLRDQRGVFLVGIVARDGELRCQGLDASHLVEHLERGHLGKALVFLVQIVAHAHPGLQSALGGEVVAYLCQGAASLSIQIYWQQLAKGSSRIVSLHKTLLSAKHQQSASAFLDKLLNQFHLARFEKLGFHVIEHNRVIGEKILGGDGKTLL